MALATVLARPLAFHARSLLPPTWARFSQLYSTSSTDGQSATESQPELAQLHAEAQDELQLRKDGGSDMGSMTLADTNFGLGMDGGEKLDPLPGFPCVSLFSQFYVSHSLRAVYL
jgi:hypothetical protein